jgi:hypothetical protein
VVASTQNTFNISATVGGTAINAAGSANSNIGFTAYNQNLALLTTASPHGLLAGDTIVLNSINGATSPSTSPFSANTLYTVASTPSPTTFYISLNGTLTQIWTPPTLPVSYTPNASPSDIYRVDTFPRIPIQVNLKGINFRKNQYAYSDQLGNLTNELSTSTVGFAAVNGAIHKNPSLHCHIPQGPQQWEIVLSQLGSSDPVIDGAGFNAVLCFQIIPVTKS